jgi:hypothetical protein
MGLHFNYGLFSGQRNRGWLCLVQEDTPLTLSTGSAKFTAFICADG